MKVYKYIQCKQLEEYEGWEIVKIIEAQPPNLTDMVVIMKEDKPIQEDIYLTEATDEQLIEELHKRLIHNNKEEL